MFYKNQKGIALVSVLVIVTLASLLGTTVWYASSMEASASEMDENQTQAYHFARSGVEIAIGLIKSGYCDDMETDVLLEFYGGLGGTFSDQETGDYNIKFSIGLDEDDYFTISSIGIVRQGVAGAAKAQDDLVFKISRANIYDDGGVGGGGNGGDGNISMALFASEGLTVNSSARINWHVPNNAVIPASVEFGSQGFIINGDLYIGPEANKDSVVEFSGNRSPEINIPDGKIINLPALRNYPLPAFPAFPADLPLKGTLATNPGNISGKVHDSNGNGIGGVTIYLSPGNPGNLVKTSLTTVNNIGWTAGHGTWAAYTGNGQGHQEGTVIVTPAKNGYTFNPQSRVVTGPISNVNFEAIPHPNANFQPLATNHNQPWCWLIDEDGDYDTISITGNRRLCIDLQGGTRILRVNRLDIQQGELILVGTGKLILYVEESFNIGGSSQVNHGGDYESLVMFFQGNQTLNFSGNTRFVGSVFAKEADISISGSNNIEGHIITGGDSVSVSGAADAYPRILYAPHANLQVTGSGTIKGTAIVNNCTVGGGNRDAITGGSLQNKTFFNTLDWGANGPPSLFLSEQEPPNQEPSASSWRGRGTWVKSE